MYEPNDHNEGLVIFITVTLALAVTGLIFGGIAYGATKMSASVPLTQDNKLTTCLANCQAQCK